MFKVEYEREQLLSSLSDAIKECQLRFGGKRELATEIDGRVCFLCQKLETIFMHGLKKRNSNSVLGNNLQLNDLANNLKQNSIFKNTGNFISQFFDETKFSALAPNSIQEHQGETSFWPFIKHFMNRFEIERYEHLTHVKTDLGRQRSWLRSCLNEHCLERFIMTVLANKKLIDQYYEDWCFLLDKSCSSSLSFLVSGLEMILFAINIDSEALNMPSKLNKSNTPIYPIPFTSEAGNSHISSSLPDNLPVISDTKVIKLKKEKPTHTKRKNNVIYFDSHDSPEQQKQTLTSPLISSNSVQDSVFETEYINDEVDRPKSPKILINSTDFPESDLSYENIKNLYIQKTNSNYNLIPVSNNFDTASIYSNQSETIEQLSMEGTVINYTAQVKHGEITNLLNRMSSQNKLLDSDGLSLKEMREFVLTLMQRKDDLDERYKRLEDKLKEEVIRNDGLVEKLRELEEEKITSTTHFENRINNLESENKLLKDQLKKYVSAVQLIRSTPNSQTMKSSESLACVSLPTLNESLQRDYSYEAEQYEKKLIQVAEMHGELMEFNTKLHLIINFKTIQLEKLKRELVELRGPLPPELIADHDEDASGALLDINENAHCPLINIWIPSAFLRSNQSESYHVYQIYVRIKDEEWNVYRRFSHFYELNSMLKEKYPIVTTIPFPKKKAIGNKDSKFVESRRVMLQNYLRLLINKISQADADLNQKPCRELLCKTVPFLNDNLSSSYRSQQGRTYSNISQSNIMNHRIRTNTTLATSNFLNGNEITVNVPISNNLQNQRVEPIYTGL